MAKVDLTVKAKDIVPLFGGSKDQITINDLELTGEQSSTIGSLIRTDKEANLTITIKN
jgi:hypothetical protein